MAQKSIQTGILAAILVLGNGITCDARPLVRRPVRVQQVEVKTPELLQADERVRAAKAQFETARKQLEAAKALLKAAEAEYKASVADREALALKERARTLADASGFPKSAQLTPSQLVVGSPATVAQASQVAAPAAEGRAAAALPGSAVNPGYGRIQQSDLNNAQPDQAPLR